jgi:diguanylate cyclase (GGDEF)-like protein
MISAASTAAAQSDAPWRFWNTADGFVESYTSSVALNGDGDVWVKHGAVGPIEMLNGYSALKNPEPGRIGQLQISPDGALWIWTQGGLKRYLESKWKSWPVDEVSRLGAIRVNTLSGFDIGYYETPALQGPIRVAALDRGHALILLPDRILEFEVRSATVRAILTLPQSHLARLVNMIEGRDGSILVTGNGGLGTIRRKDSTWQWETFPRPPAIYQAFDYPSWGQGNELFVTGITSSAATAGLRFDGKGWTEVCRGESPVLRVWSGIEGTVWVQDGNHIFQMDGGRRTVVPRNEALSGIVMGVFPESRGRFWVATSQGLAHYMPTLWRTPPAAPPLDDVVSAIAEDGKGRVWFLAARALLCLDGSRWSLYPLPGGESSWAIFTEALGVLPDGRIVLETASQHALIFDPVTARFHTLQHPGNKAMRLMIAEPGGKILFGVYAPGTTKSAIESYDGQRFTPFIAEGKLGGHIDNRSLAFGPNNEFWVGSTTAFGVSRQGHLKSIGPTDGFDDGGAYYIYRDPTGNVFAGGRDALYREQNQRWNKISSGFDRVRNITNSRDGTLWIASGTGVHRYRGGNWILNEVQDGLPSNVAYKVFEDSQGRIWAGTSRGLTLYHPEADADPPVTMLAEDLNPKEVPPGGKVRFEFSGVDKWKFTEPGRLLFSWRMDRATWSPFAPANIAVLTGLPAGSHRLEVRAMDRNGNISLVPAIHNFAVLLPWYATPEFKWLALGAALTIALLLTLATANYRHRGRLIVELNRKNRLERDRQRILQMIARRKPLTSILEQIAVAAASHGEGAACAVTFDDNGTVKVLCYPVPPESVRLQIELAVATCPATSDAWRDSLRRATAADFPGGFEIVFFGSQEGPVCGAILLLFPPKDAKKEGARMLLETFGGLASGAVESAHLYRQLGHQARHDVLTGLPNRFYFEEHLQALVGGDAALRPELALLYVDLDRFKQINDTLGHRVGDLFLKQVALRFSATLGRGSTLFRVGGDEFIVIVDDLSDRDPVEAVASQMLASLKLPIHIEGQDLFANASIGVSLCPADGETPSALQKHADLAMYQAKSRGPNHFEFYCAEMASRTQEALEIEQMLRRALEAGSFELHYQPQFTMSGELAGFEALLRLPLPERLTIGPDRFIPIAEKTGLIVAVGKWVLREACRQAREWLDDGLALSRIAVNISAIEIGRSSFADEVRDLLSSIPLDPAVLEIELTESAIIGNLAESSRQMRKLRALGVRLAIDDFGTGYSSLAHLQSLPLDTLKIDRSFVQAIRGPHDKSPVVEAIVALGRNMGLRVVAEGVETPLQLSVLSANDGCDFLQGDLLGRPATAAGARDLLRSSTSDVDMFVFSRAAGT